MTKRKKDCDPMQTTLKFKVVGINFTDAAEKTPKRLQLKVAITHAGIVNLNKAFYHPIFVRQFVETLTDKFNRPILVNHDTFSDPVGRVTGGEFVSTVSPDMKAKLEAAGVSTLLFSDIKFDADTMELEDIMPVVSRDARTIHKLFGKDKSFEGLGEVQAIFDVVDEDAIKKILDDRFLTVSIGFDTEVAFCSVHATDVYNMDGCECNRGDKVEVPTGKTNDDGEPITELEEVFFVTGPMSAREVSYVNTPADEQAKNLEIISRDSEENSLVANTVQVWSQEMTKPKSKKTIAMADDLNSDAIYALYKFEEGTEALAKDAIDKLPDTAFAGKDRSFPVHDCAHILAARTVLDGFEDTNEAKAPLLANVNRAASSLNCDDCDDYAYSYVAENVNVGVLNITTPDDIASAIELMTDEEKFSELMATHNIGASLFDEIKKNIAVAAEKFNIECDFKVEVPENTDETSETDATDDQKTGSETDGSDEPKTNEELETLRADHENLLTQYNTLTDEANELRTIKKKLLAQIVTTNADSKNALVTAILSLEKAFNPTLDGKDANERKTELLGRTLTSLKDTISDIERNNFTSDETEVTETDTTTAGKTDDESAENDPRYEDMNLLQRLIVSSDGRVNTQRYQRIFNQLQNFKR